MEGAFLQRLCDYSGELMIVLLLAMVNQESGASGPHWLGHANAWEDIKDELTLWCPDEGLKSFFRGLSRQPARLWHEGVLDSEAKLAACLLRQLRPFRCLLEDAVRGVAVPALWDKVAAWFVAYRDTLTWCSYDAYTTEFVVRLNVLACEQRVREALRAQLSCPLYRHDASDSQMLYFNARSVEEGTELARRALPEMLRGVVTVQQLVFLDDPPPAAPLDLSRCRCTLYGFDQKQAGALWQLFAEHSTQPKKRCKESVVFMASSARDAYEQAHKILGSHREPGMYLGVAVM